MSCHVTTLRPPLPLHLPSDPTIAMGSQRRTSFRRQRQPVKMDESELDQIRKARLEQLKSQRGSPGAGPSGQGQGQGQDQQKQDEARQHILNQILHPEAADRLGRIRLVKEQRATDVENRLIMLAQTGQLRQKVTEEQLKELLNAVAEKKEQEKIVVSRRKAWDDDDDDLLDLNIHDHPKFYRAAAGSSKTLGAQLLQPLPLLPLPLAYVPQVRGPLDAQLAAQVVDVALQLLLPEDVDDLLAARAVLDGPGHVDGPEALALLGLHGGDGQHAQARHGDERVGELEGLEGHLALADDGQPRQGVVEVVALAVPLHDVRALLVVDVAHLRARVGRDALAVQPRDVGVADRVLGQRAQVRHVEGLGAYAGAESEDAAAGRVGEHGVAEAVDEVGRGGSFAKGGDEVWPERLACAPPKQTADGTNRGGRDRSGT
ncbi:hypothetical protein HJFPF1_05108 [Paramyrothecium foliicola]|nr:hypothetical protein HJFPF1_05108 [Paramyrothecium foliicola]